jgi:hypothetical protein
LIAPHCDAALIAIDPDAAGFDMEYVSSSALPGESGAFPSATVTITLSVVLVPLPAAELVMIFV